MVEQNGVVVQSDSISLVNEWMSGSSSYLLVPSGLSFFLTLVFRIELRTVFPWDVPPHFYLLSLIAIQSLSFPLFLPLPHSFIRGYTLCDWNCIERTTFSWHVPSLFRMGVNAFRLFCSICFSFSCVLYPRILSRFSFSSSHSLLHNFRPGSQFLFLWVVVGIVLTHFRFHCKWFSQGFC